MCFIKLAILVFLRCVYHIVYRSLIDLSCQLEKALQLDMTSFWVWHRIIIFHKFVLTVMTVSFSQLDCPSCQPLDTSPHCCLPHQFAGRDLSCALRCASNNTLRRHDMTWIRRRFSCHLSSLLSCSLFYLLLFLSLFSLHSLWFATWAARVVWLGKVVAGFSFVVKGNAPRNFDLAMSLSRFVSMSLSIAWHFPLSFSAKRIVVLRLIEIISFVYLTN